MRTLLLFAICVLSRSGYSQEQNNFSPFGFEIIPYLSLPDVTGDNIEAEALTGLGGAFVLTYGRDLTTSLTVVSGLQLGYQRLRQETTERSNFPLPTNTVVRIVRTNVAVGQIGVPLQLRWFPLRHKGPYLKVGARYLFNVHDSTSGELVGERRVDNQLPPHPAGAVDVPGTQFQFETGIGYRSAPETGRYLYLELSFGRVAGEAIMYTEQRINNRPNYIESVNLSLLSVAFGWRFGR